MEYKNTHGQILCAFQVENVIHGSLGGAILLDIINRISIISGHHGL